MLTLLLLAGWAVEEEEEPAQLSVWLVDFEVTVESLAALSVSLVKTSQSNLSEWERNQRHKISLSCFVRFILQCFDIKTNEDSCTASEFFLDVLDLSVFTCWNVLYLEWEHLVKEVYLFWNVNSVSKIWSPEFMFDMSKSRLVRENHPFIWNRFLCNIQR